MPGIQWVIVVLVFGTVVAAVLAVSAFLRGDASSRIRVRLQALKGADDGATGASPIRARYLGRLSPLERLLEQLPGMERLGKLLEQAGSATPGYRFVLLTALLGAIAGPLAWMAFGRIVAVVLCTPLVMSLPLLKVLRERRTRIDAFETQLPDALDLMSRSLRAGNPLLDAFRFIGDEMPPPINVEFSRTWSHINYGISLKAALLDLVERAPSMSLRAMVTAVLVQRETGGNLAEVLDRIAGVLRSRIRFQRRLRTLTAEGRVSASVLVLVPFILAGVLSITSPTYLPILLEDSQGRLLLGAGAALMALGMLWVSRIVRIRV